MNSVAKSIINKLGISNDVAKKKIVVAMSGGVDSSVVATMLKEAGYDVIGVTLQLYRDDSDDGRCFGDAIVDKMRNNTDEAAKIANHIGIKHIVIKCGNEFLAEVVDNFISTYIGGKTPLPCALCNRNIKFHFMHKIMQDFEADYVATGHYVRNIRNGLSCKIHKAINLHRDQSYFLSLIKRDVLHTLLFPLGYIESKDVTRELARCYGLKNAQKVDSQDVCFIANNGYRDFIKRLAPKAYREGNIVLQDGTVVGRHNGVINYTIGQRRGIGISHKNPLYVVKINADKNEVVVGYIESLQEKREFNITGFNWLGDDEELNCESNSNVKFTVRLRSTHNGTRAMIYRISDDVARISLLDEYTALAPGQICAIYCGDAMLGGGWIEKNCS